MDRHEEGRSVAHHRRTAGVLRILIITTRRKLMEAALALMVGFIGMIILALICVAGIL